MEKTRRVVVEVIETDLIDEMMGLPKRHWNSNSNSIDIVEEGTVSRTRFVERIVVVLASEENMYFESKSVFEGIETVNIGERKKKKKYYYR